jgi:hypothetical protein
MARLYKPTNSNNYYVDFGRSAGGRVSTGTSDYDEAKEIVDTLAAKMRLGKFGLLPEEEEKPTSTGIRLSKFATKYVEFMTVTFSDTKKTAEGARSALGSLTDFYGKKDPVLDQITTGVVERWKVHILSTPSKRYKSKGKNGRSRNTLSIYFRTLHAAWNRAAIFGAMLSKTRLAMRSGLRKQSPTKSDTSMTTSSYGCTRRREQTTRRNVSTPISSRWLSSTFTVDCVVTRACSVKCPISTWVPAC